MDTVFIIKLSKMNADFYLMDAAYTIHWLKMNVDDNLMYAAFMFAKMLDFQNECRRLFDGRGRPFLNKMKNTKRSYTAFLHPKTSNTPQCYYMYSVHFWTSACVSKNTTVERTRAASFLVFSCEKVWNCPPAVISYFF